MKVDLQNRVALVTGAGANIGRAISVKLAINGADIVVNDIDEEGGSYTVDTIKELGRKAVFIKGNISDKDAMAGMAKICEEEFGKIDILVNNAAVNDKRRPFNEFLEEEWEREVNINLNGLFYCSKPIINLMIKQNYGRIINIGSIAGLVPLRCQAAYVATKAAVHTLTKAMAVELASYNINVNAVAPGSIMTEGINKLIYSDPVKSESLLSHIPLRRAGSPEDIADAVLFFSGSGANYITGTVLPVDGGWTCGFVRDW